MTAVRRTAEWVQREYGREKWPEIERSIIRACDEEPKPPSLARVVGRVARAEVNAGDSALTPQRCVLAGVELDLPRSVGFGAYQRLVIDGVLDACTDSTEAVIELGAGWGRNLFSVWLAGGPARARYVAAEYTEAGRRAADALAALAPEIAWKSFAFDYHHPVLADLGSYGEVVVFTAHSVEQVPGVTPELFDAVRELGQRVTCLHFEPVGWQLGARPGGGSSHDHAVDHDYNLDLVKMLRAEQRRGALRIEREMADIVGTNPANSTSLIRWSAG